MKKDRLADPLAVTRYLDHDHPEIVKLSRTLTGGTLNDREKAVRIHDFVRDRINFGWTSAFYNQSASAVLRAGVGFCNTKSTLFTALLRAAEIPSRQHFVSINARIVTDFIAPGTAFVDHSFTEVHLDGEWHRVDSYIVDRPLAESARRRLAKEGRMLGYGVHRHGVSEWDGRSDAFSQFVDDGRCSDLSDADHGVFADVGEFYKSGRAVNRLPFPITLLFGVFSREANRRIQALRRAA